MRLLPQCFTQELKDAAMEGVVIGLLIANGVLWAWFTQNLLPVYSSLSAFVAIEVFWHLQRTLKRNAP